MWFQNLAISCNFWAIFVQIYTEINENLHFFQLPTSWKLAKENKTNDITNMVGAGSPKAKIVKSPTWEIWKKKHWNFAAFILATAIHRYSCLSY